jgi:alpha-methylacyl-CoA racemase
MTGPLHGIRIIEFAGIGPGPYGAMLLADLGAEIIRIERPTAAAAPSPALPHPTLRGRRSICIDLSLPAGAEAALELIAGADALIEGYRPGKMEKLGLGPDICLERNPRLVYGRMTGWGQTGPNASAVGHDINYIALSGVLGMIGRRDAPPTIPLNLVGDYGGGGAFLALGLVAALLHASSSGAGQVVDVAMVDGAASLLTSFHYMRAMGRWDDERGTNQLDSGAPYYDVYETADGKWISIGAIEPAFYVRLLGKLGLSDAFWQDQQDRALWSERRRRLAELFRSQTRAHWCVLLEQADVCFAPVLAMDELVEHPHHKVRDAFILRDGVIHPAPAPRFSVTESRLGAPATEPGADTRTLLAEIGFSEERIAGLLATGVVREPPAGQS